MGMLPQTTPQCRGGRGRQAKVGDRVDAGEPPGARDQVFLTNGDDQEAAGTASDIWVLHARGATTRTHLSTAIDTATKIASKTVDKTATKMVSLLVAPNSPVTLTLSPSPLASPSVAAGLQLVTRSRCLPSPDVSLL